MNTNQIKFYLALSHLPLLRNSYFLKIIVIVFLGIVIPMFTFIYFTMTSSSGVHYNPNIFIMVLIATMVSLTFTLLLLYWLLYPISFILAAIRQYLNEEQKPQFPTNSKDIVGQLMMDIQYTIEKFESLKSSVQHIASIDTLTNIPNRLGGEQHLRQDMARVRRDGNKMLIAMLDIDKLRDINEQFGYHLGDICLTQIVDALSKSIREGDWLARWTGSQFLMVLWNFNHATPIVVLERVQQQSVKTHLGELLQISLTISATEYRGNVGLDIETDFERLLTRVDEALFQAKQAKGYGGIIVVE